MRYLRQGSGRPLVLVHGLMGYSFSWRYVMPVLSKHATVFAVDLLGAGFSDRPPDLDCRLRPSAERLLRFLKLVGIQRFDLVGTSHGGALAMLAAALLKNRPDQNQRDQNQPNQVERDHSPRNRSITQGPSAGLPAIDRLVLVAPVNPWSAHGRWLAPALGSRLGSRLFLRTVAGRPTLQKLGLWRLYGNPANIPPGTLEGYAAPAVLPGFFEYGLKIAAHWTDGLRELSAALPDITDYPTHLMWGGCDRAVFVSSAEPLRRQFRQCQLTVFPKAGHLPYEETVDDFNRTLIDFLYRPAACD